MTRTLVVMGTRNSKLGGGATTYRTQGSCPTTCPLMGKGCYARGRIFGIPERYGAEDDGEYATVRALADKRGKGLPMGGLFRANVSGDLLDDQGSLDTAYADALSHVATERPDADVFTYTHAWRTLTPDVAPGVTVNASCESAAAIEDAVSAGWPTTVVDPGGADTLIGQTIGGRKVVQCPQQTKGLTCEQCRLCARPNRKSTVAFVVHGGGKAIAARQVNAAREGN